MTDDHISDDLFGGAEIISEYSWNSRVADGDLQNVTDTAQRMGLAVPTAISHPLTAVLRKDGSIPGGPKHDRDYAWCLRFLLFTLRNAMQANRNASLITFDVVLNQITITCVAFLGPKGPNDASPALTIMLKEEYDD